VGFFPGLPKAINFAREEEVVLELWDRLDAFKRSVENKKAAGASPYTFYDGPPFATGLPHYGHLVASAIKDTVARYWTMRGHYVERRFGWDTHGLPIEMETEKALGLPGPQAIRDFGVAKFNEACRAGVLKYTAEWRRVIRRLGRWVDFDNDYKTLDKSFMESVWWVFGQLWDKGLVFKGFRVMPYSVRLSTPLSNFEANLNYQEVQDPAVTVKAKLRAYPDSYLLIWTTTPWTLPANLAIAVGAEIDYVKVKNPKDNKYYFVAQALVAQVFKDGYEIITQLKGSDLVGMSYEPIYQYSNYAQALGTKQEECFKVISSSHVTTESGTGLVHMAPSFGVEDFDACKKHGMAHFDPIDEEGRFGPLVSNLVGLSFKDADKIILKTLKDDNLLFDRSSIVHSYPFCWRSNTPLMYKAVPVWFVDVPKIKDRMSHHNAAIHWVPEAVGHKRFANWLKDAADWSISRNRFWGTPIPVWQCVSCEHQVCLSSAAELEERTGQLVNDLHSHFIDELSFACDRCQAPMSRISEVFDCWFESGSMPVAQIHYPFEHQQEFLASFPADFIAEGLDQTRGWFYTLLVISTALFDQPPFKNVIVNGMVLASDGSKMSKSKKNFPDPEQVLNDYGSDALRVYLVSSPVVRAEPLQFNEQGVKEVIRSVMLPLYNSWSFFNQYANIDNYNPKTADIISLSERPEIDRWIISELQILIATVNQEMTGYYLYKTIPPMLAFIDDLTNWYIRRNRRRFWKNAENPGEQRDKLAAYATLYEVLTTLTKILAPLLPFMSEMLYQNLVVGAGMHQHGEDSVHLATYPELNLAKIDQELAASVAVVRQVVVMGRALREKYKLKTRQPLAKITVVSHVESAKKSLLSHEELICSELNVQKLLVLSEDESLCKISGKPNFKNLGPRLGKDMALVGQEIAKLSRAQLRVLEDGGELIILGHKITESDISVAREALAELVVMTEGHLTVALDTELSPALKDEGLMREAVSLLQRLRKSSGFEVTDRIKLTLAAESPDLWRALKHYQTYMAAELLASDLELNSARLEQAELLEIDGEHLWVLIAIAKTV